MSIVDDLLQHVSLPKMIPARQLFATDALPDVAAAVRSAITEQDISVVIKPGMRIALAVGSRGMNQLPLLVATFAAELKQCGAEPFVVPSMGSHGGATAEGQREVLEALGVTEDSVGCPIRSSMETVELGQLENGLPILLDRHAAEADGIIIVNRIKPHTSFSGPYESGLVKMLAIGLGKQQGADSCHAMGFDKMAENIVAMARVKLAQAKILFGLATIENAYDRICRLELVPAAEILAREPALLKQARAQMPRLLFNPLDVLIIDHIGKNFSGTGTDPHITGRAATPHVATRQQVNKMAILDLSPESHGNATGMGLADICTRRLIDKVDFAATYANHITTTELSHGKIPLTMENDRRALQLALKTCNVLDPAQVRLVRIKNTLELGEIWISEGLRTEAEQNSALELTGSARDLSFDAEGNLTDIGGW